MSGVLEGRVRDLGREGDALVETTHGIVLAPFGLPGERVRLHDVHKRGGVLRARRLVVLEPSPDRVEPPCAHVERCGGCPWMHASERVQIEAKRRAITRALARVPRAGSDFPIEVAGPRERLGYRRRARLAYARVGSGVVLGFRARRSDRVIDVARCVVLRAELDALWAPLRARIAPHLPGYGEVHLAIGQGGRPVVAIETEAVPSRGLYEALHGLLGEGAIAGASVRAGGATAATDIGAPHEVGPDVEGRLLRGTVGGFSQAHEETNARLGARAIALAEARGARVLELYAGHGNLTLALAARAARVLAVERSAQATAALRANLAAHGLEDRVAVIADDVARAMPSSRCDVVVLDPPRTGARDVMDRIAAVGPARVVYVSCHPATLGRDLERLAAHGYVLDAAEGFDMFPQTPHVEVVVRMVRAARMPKGRASASDRRP